MSTELVELAALLRQRDEVDAKIAAMTGRSARQGDVGEFIAARIFDIKLAGTAIQAGHDGTFRSGPLAGRTVNVKTYGNLHDGLDISPHDCDLYLVLAGPPRPPGAVRHHRWRISAVYLLDRQRLLETLAGRGVTVGTATSLRRADINAAQIYPEADVRSALRLTPEQIFLLRLFG
ncbi:hypothetical protein [Plantactinospora sonchi]|uniref:Restriction endonuclease n=1 Tax=Plantactinospora sonchi TaxID=1544735 RepID=A0ABU7S2X1_9ACTN